MTRLIALSPGGPAPAAQLSTCDVGVWRRKSDAVVRPYRDARSDETARLAELVTAALTSLGAEAIVRGGPAVVAEAVHTALCKEQGC